jgi:lysozyme family protein
MLAKFEPAWDLVRKQEAGFQCDHGDRGNWTSGQIGVGELKGTNMGISAMSYPHEDIRHMTPERASEIYFKDFWLKGYGKFEDQGVANKLLSMAVNMERFGGHGPAVGILQRAITACGHPVTEDETLGPQTIYAANGIPAIQLLTSMRSECLSHYRRIAQANPQEAKFLKGWEQRALS